jgi:hypothetical protein
MDQAKRQKQEWRQGRIVAHFGWSGLLTTRGRESYTVLATVNALGFETSVPRQARRFQRFTKTLSYLIRQVRYPVE